jgi:hypothetical protein
MGFFSSSYLYDNNFVIQYTILFQSYFEHLTIIADNHFCKATSHFENITLITSKSKARRKKKIDSILVLQKLSKENKIINNVIFDIRGKEEASYA